MRSNFQVKFRPMIKPAPVLSSSHPRAERLRPRRGPAAPEAPPARGRRAVALRGGAVAGPVEGQVRGKDRDRDFFEGRDGHRLVEREGARRANGVRAPRRRGARRFPPRRRRRAVTTSVSPFKEIFLPVPGSWRSPIRERSNPRTPRASSGRRTEATGTRSATSRPSTRAAPFRASTSRPSRLPGS